MDAQKLSRFTLELCILPHKIEQWDYCVREMLVCVFSKGVTFANCQNEELYKKQIEYLTRTILSNNLLNENGSLLIPLFKLLIYVVCLSFLLHKRKLAEWSWQDKMPFLWTSPCLHQMCRAQKYNQHILSSYCPKGTA